jgi:hypothetical protein
MSEAFSDAYTRHVGYVRNGDIAGAMGDMHPDTLATVFDGVTAPAGKVASAEIRSISAGETDAEGETVYTMADGAVIGLRSIWVLESGRWLAVRLENFEADPAAD